MHRFVGWLGGWSVAMCAAVVQCADWPQWGGRDNRNMVSGEKGLPDSFVPGEKNPKGGGIDMATTQNVKWVARLGSAAYGNPTVAGGRVFVGTDDLTVTKDPRFRRTRGGMVKCFDEATGKVLWQLVVPERKRLPSGILFSHQHLGVCSSPAIASKPTPANPPGFMRPRPRPGEAPWSPTARCSSATRKTST